MEPRGRVLLDNEPEVLRWFHTGRPARLRGFGEVAFGLVAREFVGCHRGNNRSPLVMFRIEAPGTSGKYARFCRGRSLNMHHCAFCNNPLRRLTEWKGIDGRFYCSEFCADAGDSEMPSPSK